MNRPIANWQTRVLQANLVAQTLIVVTGALVRVTSSGLGCPTWPECVEGSVTPTGEQTESWHKYVEFGNRLLTGALLLIAVAAFVTVLIINRQRVAGGLGKRAHLTKLSLLVIGGIFFQAILGGITVLTGLHPLIVGAHFLVSTGLIAISFLLLHRALEPNEAVFETLAKPVKYLIQAITANVLIIIVLGILVTGTGPHAGDSAEVPRLGFDPVTIAHIHATAVQLFFGLVIGLIVAVLANDSSRLFFRRSIVLLFVGLAQGAIGYIQYFTGLPWVLVAFHVLGACLLWLATLNLLALTIAPKQLPQTVGVN